MHRSGWHHPVKTSKMKKELPDSSVGKESACCCCCCCCVTSVVSDSVWPHRWQPTGLRHPWDYPGKNTGEGCRFLLQSMKVKSESEVTQSCLTQRPHGLQPTRLLHPWEFPGKSTRVGCHCLLRRIHLQCGKPGFDPWVGKIPWRREQLLLYSDLENSMDCTVYGVSKSQTIWTKWILLYII